MADQSDDSRVDKDMEPARKSSRLLKVNSVYGSLKKPDKRRAAISPEPREEEIYYEKKRKRIEHTPKKRNSVEHKKTDKKNKPVTNNILKEEVTPAEEEAVDEPDEEEIMDDSVDEEEEEEEEDNANKSKEKSGSESDFGPAMLGLHRVGDELPKRDKQLSVQLNARGMPQRIRKKNKLFFDDDAIFTTLKEKKKEKELKKKDKSLGKIKKVENKKEEPEERIIPVLTATDKEKGHRIGIKLRNLLKLPKAHRWVCYEWFYSNIDSALFNGNDFMNCFKLSFPHLKAKNLTKTEWCKIRRLLGKPRRCSQAFLKEERAELEKKRSKIRLLQQRKLNELSLIKDLPEKVPMQLRVGSKVTARLRKPQDGLFTGTVEAVDTSNNTYRITFERAGLGTHSVHDYEVLSSEEIDYFSLSSTTKRLQNLSKFMPLQPFKPVVPEPKKPEPKLSLKLLQAYVKDGPYPFKMLELSVQLSKLLGIKKTMIEKIKELNSVAEFKCSYEENYPSEFQTQYATLVLEFDKLNYKLERYMKEVRSFCMKIAPEKSREVLLAPNMLTSVSHDEAVKLVEKHTSQLSEKNPELNKHFSDLVVNLITVMLQVKSLSESDQNSHELDDVKATLSDIKDNLDPSNHLVYENNVAMHINYMQHGLGQSSTVQSFIIPKQYKYRPSNQ